MLRPRPLRPWVARVASASTPPSPLLSARMIRVTYLTVTVSVIDQNRIDTTPSTWRGEGVMPEPWVKVSRRVESGLVPMSPNTTPSAPTTMAAAAALAGEGPAVPPADIVTAGEGDGRSSSGAIGETPPRGGGGATVCARPSGLSTRQ